MLLQAITLNSVYQFRLNPNTGCQVRAAMGGTILTDITGKPAEQWQPIQDAEMTHLGRGNLIRIKLAGHGWVHTSTVFQVEAIIGDDLVVCDKLDFAEHVHWGFYGSVQDIRRLEHALAITDEDVDDVVAAAS